MKDFMDENELEHELEPVEDDITDDAELEDMEENSAQKIKQLKKKLQESEKEKMEHLENLQRAKAEFLNAKRRLEDERLADKERAIVRQIEKLLPMCDSFHMAVSNKEAWESIDPTWRKGIESIYNQLQSILTSYSVTEFNPVGAEFDPNKHEAMTNVKVDSKEMDHKVVSVIQNGYIRTNGDSEQLIRPARVTVGEYSE